MLANKEKGEFALTAGDRKFLLRITTNACCELEDFANGRTWDQVMTGMRKGSLRDVRFFLWTALREHHSDLASDKPESIKDVGRLIDDFGGLSGILTQLQAFLEMNLEPPTIDDAQKTPGSGETSRPPDAQAGTGDSSTSTPAASA